MSDCGEEQDFDDTVSENGYFSELYERYSSPEKFLKRSEKVYARGVTVTEIESDVWLTYLADIDGCVVELKGIYAIQIPIRHITICPHGLASVRELKSLLKKHVNLTQYSANLLRNFNNSVGMQLFYERGWEGWIGFIPDPTVKSTAWEKEAIKQQSYNKFLELRAKLRRILFAYAANGVACRTLMKNVLNDLSKFFILPNDCRSILDAIHRAMGGLEWSGFKLIVFCYRFGEKMTNGLSLTEFCQEGVEKITVHAAIDISSDCGINLLWSMGGLQNVVGERGRLNTCLSFTDCGNFQSNIDGKHLTIDNALRDICKYQVMFVQLYADLPHMKPKTRLHPVSGSIVAGRFFAKPTALAFFKDAENYLSAMHSNFQLMRTSTCRIEFVTELTSPTDIVQASDCLDLSKLVDLLTCKPMLVPFPPSTIECVRHLGLWMTGELKKTLQAYRNTGNVSATWYAFQLELALECMLWGGPHCYRSIRYAVNLGPGIQGVSRSLTDYLGFLALEEPTSCLSSDDSIPNYLIWTLSEVVGKSIMRAAGFHDHLEGSYTTIGRRLLHALLGDLYEFGKISSYVLFEEFMREMKSRRTKFQVTGAVTKQALVEILSKRRRTRPNMVFGHLCDLIVCSSASLEEVISSGLKEMNLKHFPALQITDEHRNAVLSWSFKNNFWKIIENNKDEPICNQSPELYTNLVKSELDRRGIIFPSRVKNLPASLPWIESCLQKLSREKLILEDLVKTLTFITCLALLMQGWFVEFDRLHALVNEVPISQNRLKVLEIQSKLEMANFKFRQLTLYRLHHSIPHHLSVTSTKKGNTSSNASSPERPSPDIAHTESCINMIEEDNVLTKQFIVKRTSSCRPVCQSNKLKWSSEELEILHNVASMRSTKSMKELYDVFKSKCLELQIPFRTFRAFESKLRRIN